MCHFDEDSVVYVGEAAEQEQALPGSDRPIPTFTYGYRPADRRPAVVIVHDVTGANPFYRDLGARLADAGFAALLPDLFCREPPLTGFSREVIMARAAGFSLPRALTDLAALVAPLAQEGRQVGMIGFCMGGTLALLAAGRVPGLQAAVVYYGFPVNAHPTPTRPDNPIAEVGGLQAPVLGFFGEEDHGVGPDNVRAYAAAAAAAGKAVDFTLYPQVGHGFLSFDPAATSAAASQDSWARALAFFRTHLQTVAA